MHQVPLRPMLHRQHLPRITWTFIVLALIVILALGLRLQRHAELFAAGESLSNHVDPAALDPWVRAELKEYFKAVRVAQEHVASTYLVGMLG